MPRILVTFRIGCPIIRPGLSTPDSPCPVPYTAGCCRRRASRWIRPDCRRRPAFAGADGVVRARGGRETRDGRDRSPMPAGCSIALGDRLAFVITDIKLGDGSGLDLVQARPRDASGPAGGADHRVRQHGRGGRGDEGGSVLLLHEAGRLSRCCCVWFARLSRNERLAEQVVDLQARLAAAGRDRIAGVESGAARPRCNLATSVAGLDTTVLLVGETGTGKELFAEYIHDRSDRRRRTARGNQLRRAAGAVARVRALRTRTGRVHRRGRPQARQVRAGARRHASSSTRSAIWRCRCRRSCCACSNRSAIEPLGWPARHRRRRPDSWRRPIATFAALIEAGQFREDLYYRLAAFPIVLPPLRDRPEDIRHSAERFPRGSLRAPTTRRSTDSTPMRSMQCRRHAWPGNVRELRHTVERAVILTTGRTITRAQLPLERATGAETRVPADMDNLADLQGSRARGGAACGGGRRRQPDPRRPNPGNYAQPDPLPLAEDDARSVTDLDAPVRRFLSASGF